MGKAFQIVLVRPADFIYVESWREAIDAMRYGLKELGFEVSVAENRITHGGRPIIFGAHHMTAGMEERLPPDSIIYNLEQLLIGYPWYSERYLSLLKRFEVWDFHAHNVAHMQAEDINISARHVPIGYVPELSTITAVVEDVDVLFYGILTERRQKLLQALVASKLNVIALRGVFGAQRDSWIARAKVVLNLHQEAGGYFEALRVMHLMANQKAVVTECDDPSEIDARFRPGLCAVPYDQLHERCVALVKNDIERNALSIAALNAVRHPELRMSAILARILLG